MKRTAFLFLIALATAVAAQERQRNLGLIPTPQRVEMGNGYCSRSVMQKMPRTEYVDTLPAEANLNQAYQLTIGKKSITIRCIKGGEGERYALMTLAQLEQIHGSDSVPCCTITDWPAYRLRGWMDDQSRGPVPHDTYRQRQWQALHALKYNFCNYYTEHTLYQEEYPDLAPAYAVTKRHPDEFINLQFFAHAEKTLRIPFYQDLMDSRANFNPASDHISDFLFSRIVEAMKQNPTSPYFIINCDETEQLGTGRARHYVDSLGADQVYVDHINHCHDLIEQAHFFLHSNELGEKDSIDAPLVAMWGDIVAKSPQMMKQLPEDMVYIMWAYEPLDSFDNLIKPFKEQGNPFWVASSSSHSGVMIPEPQRYVKFIATGCVAVPREP